MAGDLAMLVIVFLALIGPGSGGRGTPEVGDRLPSAEQSRRILKIHNDLRRLQDAADMEYMEWSQSLAEISQDTATKCIFRSGNSGQEQIMSQNMAALSSTTNITEMTSAVTWWYDDTYDVNTSYCKEPARCNQHLQLIWASTNEVGCAYSICDTLANAETNETSDNVTLFVCTYHLGLSTSGDSPRPFVPGPACSQCRSGADWCDMIEPRGLCRRNCDDAMVGCILNNKEIMDSIFSSNHTTGTLDEDPPNTVTENPNKYNPDMKTANDVTLSSRDTSNRVTFTNHEKLSPRPSSRITRDIRSTVTISSLTSARSGTDGSDVTQPQTEQLTSHYRNTMTELSTRMTSSSTEPMESNSSLTTSITTQIDRSFINGGQTSSASHVSSALWVVDESSTSEIDVIPETGQSADRPRTASFVTVKDVDVGTSFKTKQQQQQTPAVHSIVCDSATSSQESGTPRDSSSEFLDSSSSSLANAKTSIPELYTTTNGLYQSTSAPDDVLSRALTGITPLHGILPTTTTTYSNVYVPDFVRIIDNTSPPNKTFWITVILIVSVDSILLVAIAVLGIVIFKRKQLEESDEKCSGQDDGESVSSECKYYHFNFEVLQNEATV